MRTTFLFLFISFLLLTIGCDQGTQTDVTPIEQNVGEVSFSLAKGTIPSEVKVVAVRLERFGYQTIRDSVAVTGTVDTIRFQLKNVPAGSWSLTVEARDSLNSVRYTGKATISVYQGETTRVIVYMTPTSPTTGTVEVTVVWTAPSYKWIMSAKNPVLQQTPGSWDEGHFFFHSPCVLKINSIYRVWYTTGYSESVNKTQMEWIAYATSADGIHWTKQGVALYPGPIGSWNERGPLWPTVLYENGKFKMWYGGNSGNAYRTGIGYAESTDGVEWAVRAQPVLTSNSEQPELWQPFVLKKDNIYFLYFGIRSSMSGAIDVYLMTSVDGINWANRKKILSARVEVPWERNGIVGPRIFYDQNKFRMFYTALAADNSISVGYAESLDGIQWTRFTTSPVLQASNTLPWQTTWVGYVSPLKDENKIKLWFAALTSQPYRWQIGYAEHFE